MISQWLSSTNSPTIHYPFWNGANWWLIQYSANTLRNGHRLNSCLIGSSINYLSYNLCSAFQRGLRCIVFIVKRCAFLNDFHRWTMKIDIDYGWMVVVVSLSRNHGLQYSFQQPHVSQRNKKNVNAQWIKNWIQSMGMHYQCVCVVFDGLLTFALGMMTISFYIRAHARTFIQVDFQDRWLRLEYSLQLTILMMLCSFFIDHLFVISSKEKSDQN